MKMSRKAEDTREQYENSWAERINVNMSQAAISEQSWTTKKITWKSVEFQFGK